jgi:hypothetical protein
MRGAVNSLALAAAKNGEKFSGNRPHHLPREAPPRIATRQLLSPISKHPDNPFSLDTYCTDRTKTRRFGYTHRPPAKPNTRRASTGKRGGWMAWCRGQSRRGERRGTEGELVVQLVLALCWNYALEAIIKMLLL